MATRKILTDEQVALEIERLKKRMEKHGKELAAAGITLENIAQQLADIPDDENEEGGC